jgi:hypothetical protein
MGRTGSTGKQDRGDVQLTDARSRGPLDSAAGDFRLQSVPRTHPAAIAAKYRSLSEPAVDELKRLPALFCYERRVNDVARVGRITHIQRGAKLTVNWEFDLRVPPIQPHVLEGLYDALDINARSGEAHRDHWAVKEVDLYQVLIQAGILTPQAPPPPPPPKVFISYSWGSPEHEHWVASLAGYLRGLGIDAQLDKWSVHPGHDLPTFMEQSMRSADRVLLICTEDYVEKALQRRGGVGYEHVLVVGELMQNVGTDKFIPVICRTQPHPLILPPYLASRYHIDLSAGPQYQGQLDALVRELHRIRVPLPPLGQNPFG